MTRRVPRCGRGGADAAVSRTETKAVELGRSGGWHCKGEVGGLGRSSEDCPPPHLIDPQSRWRGPEHLKVRGTSAGVPHTSQGAPGLTSRRLVLAFGERVVERVREGKISES